ncbi:MAG: arsenate reductase ArsC [Xanthomonadaceae bacterium]|nr:arsenate reductase ArsC [Xanthomonadaceae bacterium]MDE2496467.1 arsenate reductase ArsC [Xanthomonadaceae bacterium]
MPLRLLFLCTHNSARSIVAEGLANRLGDDRLRAFSAGSHPSGRVHPLALEVLRERGCATDGLHSKSWDVYAGAEPMDAVITVCDTTAGEICPLWPGAPARVHWDLPDPSGVGGDERERLVAFRHTAGYLAARLQRVLSLPLDDFDIATLESELQCIHDTAVRGE